ncbi:hypothetical protein [Embleya sp. NPDC020630]|uniref:hypothetical protein n=1 Tax=Embleya sp. NPDC020630 TaxID=3363979 RepID=UPI0037AA3FBF
MNTSVDVGDVPRPAGGERGRLEVAVPGAPSESRDAVWPWTELFSSDAGTVWGSCGASVTHLERDVRDLLAKELGAIARSIPSHRFAALVDAIRQLLTAERHTALVFHRLPTRRGTDRVGVWVCRREAFAFHSRPLAAAWVEHLALAYDGVAVGFDRPLALLGAGPARYEQERAAS